MKVTYYLYYLNDADQKVRVNLKGLISTFCKIKNQGFINSFKTDGGENLYLFFVAKDLYIFIVTKNSEIIKAINSRSIDYKDVYEKLASDESLGFASYVCISDDYYGIASTVYGPRNGAFVAFLNKILERMPENKFKIESSPFPTQSTAKQVLKLPFVGVTTLEVGANNSLAKTIKEHFCISDFDDVDAFEIRIKPQKKKDITKSFHGFCEKIDSDGLRKYIVKAKDELESALTDYYIVGNGHISDYIKKSNEGNMLTELAKKVQNKSAVKEIVEGLKNDKKLIDKKIEYIQAYCKSDSWNIILADY